jgi:hypothetical protein
MACRKSWNVGERVKVTIQSVIKHKIFDTFQCINILRYNQRLSDQRQRLQKDDRIDCASFISDAFFYGRRFRLCTRALPASANVFWSVLFILAILLPFAFSISRSDDVMSRICDRFLMPEIGSKRAE